MPGQVLADAATRTAATQRGASSGSVDVFTALPSMLHYEASSSSSGATRSPSKDRMSKHNLTGNSSSVCPDGQDVFPFTAEKAQHSRYGCPLDT